MTKVSDVYKYIDSFAPFRTQDSWDNSGLLAGDENAQVHKALVALDAENRIIDEAHRKGCELLITHHPVIFHPLKTVCFDDPAGRLVRYGMSCICAHTNLDSAQYGISDMMLYRLGFKNCHELVQINRRDSLSDRAVGYGAIGECSEMTPEELAKLCAERFRCVAIKYVAGKRNIKRVGVISGAGGDGIFDAKRLGLDAYITAEVKHHEFLEAERIGVTLIDAGHYETEIIAAEYLKQKLEKEFSDVSFVTSGEGTTIKTVK